jgi:hypothetical protein
MIAPAARNRETVAPDGYPAWSRLEDQIAWYDRKSQENQRWFKRLKVCQIVTAAAIPVAAGVSAPAWLMGGGGALIVVLEACSSFSRTSRTGRHIAPPASALSTTSACISRELVPKPRLRSRTRC